MYGGAKSNSRKTKKRNNSKKRGKLNLDKLANSTLLISSAVASLSKGQQKTLKKKIKQKRTKMKKKGKKRVKSGTSTLGGGDELVKYMGADGKFHLFNPNAEDWWDRHAVLREDTWTGPGDSNIIIKDPEGHEIPLQWDSVHMRWLETHFAPDDAIF